MTTPRLLRAVRRLGLLGCAVSLMGCQSLPSLPSLLSLPSADNLLGPITPYRLEIVQGNVITKEQAERVKPGMSRAQVRDLFGTPLLADLFHADRWDYVFTIRRQGAPAQARTVVVLFSGESVKSIDTGGDLPSEREFVASIDPVKPIQNVPLLAPTEEQRKALPTPPRAPPAPDAVPDVAARTYPPLENPGP